MRRGLVAGRFKGKGPTAKTVQNQIKEERRHKVFLKALKENVVELYIKQLYKS
jgi:hypothetical protein